MQPGFVCVDRRSSSGDQIGLRLPPPDNNLTAYYRRSIVCILYEHRGVIRVSGFLRYLPSRNIHFEDTKSDRPTMAALQNNLTTYIIGNLCRVCLTENESTVNVLGNTELIEHVSSYFGIQINGNEQKSTMLCSKCLGKINVWLADKRKAEKNQIVVEFLAIRSSSNHAEREHSVELSTSNSTDFDKTDKSPELNKSIRTTKDKNLCPFCPNYDKTSIIDKKNFCKKHFAPLTCLVSNCNLVFPNKNNWVLHYRSHLNLPSNVYLCSICFNVLDCPRNERKTKHTHDFKTYKCCSIVFQTMTDLVCHKLQEHNGQVFKRHVNKNDLVTEPLNQNQISAKRIKIDKIIDVPSIPESCLPEYSGLYVCNHCYTLFSSIDKFVEHSRLIHGIQYQKKVMDIQLCPLCENNYDSANYVMHIAKCVDSMKVGDDSLNKYGCIYCQEIFSDMTQTQFRHHLRFCKSFEVVGIDDGSKKTRKCKNCIFESTDLEKCLKHANSYCMSFKLKMKYSKQSQSNEKEKFSERISLREKFEKDVMKYFVKPENPSDDDVHGQINPSYCDWSRQTFLGNFNFFCNICKKGFFSLNVFENHLAFKAVKCRPSTLVYCIRCVSDFETIVKFNNHLPIISSSVIKTEINDTTVCNEHKPIIITKSIKMEPKNEEENIVINDRSVNNNEDINNLDTKESTLYQLSKVSNLDFNSTHESTTLMFNDQLFTEFESPDEIEMKCTVENEDKSNISNSLASSS